MLILERPHNHKATFLSKWPILASRPKSRLFFSSETSWVANGPRDRKAPHFCAHAAYHSPEAFRHLPRFSAALGLGHNSGACSAQTC